MKKLTVGVLILAAVLLLAPQASAQCPAQPLQTLVGTWVFQVEGVSYWGTAAVGRFTASIGTNAAGQPLGVLRVVESSNQSGPGGNGLVNRFLSYQGVYTIVDDCSGGTLMMNSNFNQHVQYEFYFRPSATGLEIVMVSISGLTYLTPVQRYLQADNIAASDLWFLTVQPVIAGMARKI